MFIDTRRDLARQIIFHLEIVGEVIGWTSKEVEQFTDSMPIEYVSIHRNISYGPIVLHEYEYTVIYACVVTRSYSQEKRGLPCWLMKCA